MTTQPGDGTDASRYARTRVPDADRERAIDVLRAAFAEGRLTREEHAEHVRGGDLDRNPVRTRSPVSAASWAASMNRSPIGVAMTRTSQPASWASRTNSSTLDAAGHGGSRRLRAVSRRR